VSQDQNRKRPRSSSPEAVPGRTVRKLGRKLGNQAVAKLVQDGQVQRDDVLALIVGRLEAIERVQDQEFAKLSQRATWVRKVARKKDAAPDPTRWHACATLFREAAKLVARGELGRGVQVLRRALEAEQVAFREIPDMLKADVDLDDRPTETPGLKQVAFAAVCAPCSPPEELAIVDRILSIDPRVAAAALKRKSRHRDIWFPEDELAEGDDEGGGDEDGDDDEGGGGDGGNGGDGGDGGDGHEMPEEPS